MLQIQLKQFIKIDIFEAQGILERLKLDEIEAANSLLMASGFLGRQTVRQAGR